MTELALQQKPKNVLSTLSTKDKLPNGYHYTERYGEVFINAGVAWVIKEMPTTHELRSVSVKITPADLKKPETSVFKTSVGERLRARQTKRLQRANSKGKSITLPLPGMSKTGVLKNVD